MTYNARIESTDGRLTIFRQLIFFRHFLHLRYVLFLFGQLLHLDRFILFYFLTLQPHGLDFIFGQRLPLKR